MKKLLIPACLLLCSAACKNATDKTATEAAPKQVYAYTIDKPDNWEIGSSQNIATVLSSLKAFEDNKLDESISFFADSVNWKADYFDLKLSKDSLKAMMNTWRNGYASVSIHMHDFVSNVSKDKKDEWVTMWYTEVMTDKTGKIDSLACINDARLVNGKIAELNEYTRHFPAKK